MIQFDLRIFFNWVGKKNHQLALRMIQNVSPEYLKAFAYGWLWLDFVSVPQVSVSFEDSERGSMVEGCDNGNGWKWLHP